jgi:NaMN:DMB phosphoribosyltransferase
MPADLAGNSRESGDRLTKPAGATSTPSLITVATETPSGMDKSFLVYRNIPVKD